MIKETEFLQICEIVGADRVHQDESMARHTTFRIGGTADVVAEPSSLAQVQNLIQFLKKQEIPYYILGNGSNVLVGDKGIRGVVVKLEKAFSACSVNENRIEAEAGIKLSRLANIALEHSLTGMECLAGIPGTLGGAVYMNAGAYGGEISQLVESVTYLDETGELKEITGEACEFGYRTSFFLKNPAYLIVKTVLRLEKGDPVAIREKMDDLADRRVSKQPLNLPSAGSTFRRPEGHFAGKLIQDAGLMGFRVGGASVSEKHAGFVVNDQNATAEDVRNLIAEIQKRVYDAHGVMLQTEVRFLGEF